MKRYQYPLFSARRVQFRYFHLKIFQNNVISLCREGCKADLSLMPNIGFGGCSLGLRMYSSGLRGLNRIPTSFDDIHPNANSSERMGAVYMNNVEHFQQWSGQQNHHPVNDGGSSSHSHAENSVQQSPGHLGNVNAMGSQQINGNWSSNSGPSQYYLNNRSAINADMHHPGGYQQEKTGSQQSVNAYHTTDTLGALSRYGNIPSSQQQWTPASGENLSVGDDYFWKEFERIQSQKEGQGEVSCRSIRGSYTGYAANAKRRSNIDGGSRSQSYAKNSVQQNPGYLSNVNAMGSQQINGNWSSNSGPSQYYPNSPSVINAGKHHPGDYHQENTDVQRSSNYQPIETLGASRPQYQNLNVPQQQWTAVPGGNSSVGGDYFCREFECIQSQNEGQGEMSYRSVRGSDMGYMANVKSRSNIDGVSSSQNYAEKAVQLSPGYLGHVNAVGSQQINGNWSSNSGPSQYYPNNPSVINDGTHHPGGYQQENTAVLRSSNYQPIETSGASRPHYQNLDMPQQQWTAGSSENSSVGGDYFWREFERIQSQKEGQGEVSYRSVRGSYMGYAANVKRRSDTDGGSRSQSNAENSVQQNPGCLGHVNTIGFQQINGNWSSNSGPSQYYPNNPSVINAGKHHPGGYQQENNAVQRSLNYQAIETLGASTPQYQNLNLPQQCTVVSGENSSVGGDYFWREFERIQYQKEDQGEMSRSVRGSETGYMANVKSRSNIDGGSSSHNYAEKAVERNPSYIGSHQINGNWSSSSGPSQCYPNNPSMINAGMHHPGGYQQETTGVQRSLNYQPTEMLGASRPLYQNLDVSQQQWSSASGGNSSGEDNYSWREFERIKSQKEGLGEVSYRSVRESVTKFAANVKSRSNIDGGPSSQNNAEKAFLQSPGYLGHINATRSQQINGNRSSNSGPSQYFLNNPSAVNAGTHHPGDYQQENTGAQQSLKSYHPTDTLGALSRYSNIPSSQQQGTATSGRNSNVGDDYFWRKFESIQSQKEGQGVVSYQRVPSTASGGSSSVGDDYFWKEFERIHSQKEGQGVVSYRSVRESDTGCATNVKCRTNINGGSSSHILAEKAVQQSLGYLGHTNGMGSHQNNGNWSTNSGPSQYYLNNPSTRNAGVYHPGGYPQENTAVQRNLNYQPTETLGASRSQYQNLNVSQPQSASASGGNSGQINEMKDDEDVEGTLLKELDAFCTGWDLVGAVECMKNLSSRGVSINLPRYLALIEACGEAKALVEAKAVHEHLIKFFSPLSTSIFNRLIDMYGKCGSMSDAYDAFNNTPECNLTTWNNIISSYAKNGLGEEAIDMFTKFKESGLKPDGEMFFSLFDACGVVGDVVEGMLHFESMSNIYGIAPTMDHYASIVRMFGSAGDLDGALEFIEKIPVEPSVDVWESLMNMSRIQGNIELGDRCAQIVEQLDPSRLTKETKTGLLPVKGFDALKKKVKKTSLSEHGRHEYRAGDRSHPEQEKIYTLLRGFKESMKEAGYVPETRFVLHDVDQEDKEEAIMAHSERLACASFLLTSSPRAQMRIIKNLRVCGDCHNVFKIISKLVGRTIVMRDQKRFHHFQDGKCSCNDYW